MSPSTRRIDRLEEEFGELLEEREKAADLDSFAEYRDDPVGFIREVIGDDPWEAQVRVAEAVRDRPLVTLRSCNGAGKDWLAGRLSLWWSVCRQGLAVLTSATRQQVEETLMRREVRDAFSKARELPGSLHVRAYRPHGEGRAGIIAKTASEVSALTGLHDAAVLFCISEAQHEGLGVAFDAAFATAVGEGDRVFAYGNPTNPSGRFYRSHRPSSDWTSIRIPASDVPNVKHGEVRIPGLVTVEGVNRIAREYGTESGYYMGRVLAEFPTEAEEGVFRREWLDAAAERFESRELHRDLHEEEPLLAVDVARHGSDATVAALRRGPVLESFTSWRGADTTETVERVETVAREGGLRRDHEGRYRFQSTEARGRIVVDAVGLGAGVYDALKARGWKVDEYKGSRSAKDDERHHNRRAEAFWTLRKRLEDGNLALPDSEELFEELLAVRWRPDGRGRVQLEAKRDMASRLGRSPDKADALAMAYGRDVGPRPAKMRIVKF